MGDQNSNRVDYTTMKTFQILAILACVAGLNAGSIVGKPIVGKCPPVITTKPDFDYKQYAGIWYEIERVPVIFESGMSCVQATYNEISKQLFPSLFLFQRPSHKPFLIKNRRGCHQR